MNKFKTNARILLVIIVSAFIIIPIAAVLLSKVLGVHEGMTGKNVNMDRINMEGVAFKNKNDDEVTGGAGDYLYCVGGDIACDDDDGTDTLQADGTGTYDDAGGGSGGSSYKSTCTNKANAVCKNNHVKTTADNSVSFYDSDGNEWPYYGPSNNEFKGYLGPYSYIPMKISDKYVYLYDDAAGAYSSEAISACYLYGDCPDADPGPDPDPGPGVGGADADAPENSNVSTMKCLADNGAKPGDPLCCGQDGVLQDTKYNCPSEYPHCVGYKCGETWGKCSTTEQ